MIIENISKENQAPTTSNADQRSALEVVGGIRFKHFSINM
jgi:hypothetical protein